MPVYLAGRLRKKKLVYDAHELFSQQKEIITRAFVYKVWLWIEKTFVPKFRHGYTVSQSIAGHFNRQYAVSYELIMNASLLRPSNTDAEKKERYLLYQGAVNEARGLEFLVPAMAKIDAALYIYGDGNFMEQTHLLIKKYGLQEKVFIKPKVLPDELAAVTKKAYIGLNLVENNGLNQYYSLANKFFDYFHAELPQITMNFPEYKRINDEFKVALLIDDLNEETIIASANKLLQNETLYSELRNNCKKAREALNWQNEEKKLIKFYKDIFE